MIITFTMNSKNIYEEFQEIMKNLTDKELKNLPTNQDNKMQWISIQDKLPQFGIQYRYLFVNGKGEVTFGYAYDPKEGWDTGNSHSIWINDHDRCTNEVATHWMPLPSPPQK